MRRNSITLVFLAHLLLSAAGPGLAMERNEQEAAAEPTAVPMLSEWAVVRSGTRSWQVVSGGSLQVEMLSPIDSETANVGDSCEARLTAPMRSQSGAILARAGSIVTGHVTAVDRSSRIIKADIPSHHWLDANGALGLEFDQVVASGSQIDLHATPVPGSEVARSNASGNPMPLEVDKKGDVTVKYSGVKYGAMSTAIEGGELATGPIGLVAGPLISGVVGAVSPAYSYGKPAQDVEGHRRIKGFFLGMVKGLPGGGLLTGAVEHGENISLSAGDRLLLEVRTPASKSD
jgi:hypothetical protein